MKWFILIFLSQVITNITHGQGKDTTCSPPSPRQVKNLCILVENRAPDEDENSRYNFLWQKLIEQMACIDYLNDNPETVKRKVQKWWKNYHDDCKCNIASFIVGDGNVLKYAAQYNFEDFFYTILKEYELNMNFIDPRDGKTVLDFTLDVYEVFKKSNPNSPKSKSFQKIIELLKANGAKRAKDL